MRSSKRLMRALLPDCHFGSSARVNTLNTPPPSLSIRMKVSTSIPGPTPSIVFRTTKRYSGARRIRAVLIVIVFEQERKYSERLLRCSDTRKRRRQGRRGKYYVSVVFLRFLIELPRRLHCDMHARFDDVRIFQKWWHGFGQKCYET